MYKVFLVDDEIVVREGIRTSFPWDSSGFVLAGEAPDGEIALSLLREIKPDILITDIRMPFMDGLALSREALAFMPSLKIIILSGYDEFTYAREALTLGVKEYLLKPVSAQELENALRRVSLQIDEDRRLHADLQAVRKQLELSSGLMKEQFLREVLQGIRDEEKRSNVFLNARKLDIELTKRYCRVMLISIRQTAPTDTLLPKALVTRVADSQPKGSVYLCQLDGLLAMLYLSDDAGVMEEQVFGVAGAIKHEAADLDLPAMHIAIGSQAGSIYQAPDSLASAFVTLKAMRGHMSEDSTSIMDNADTQAEMSEVISLADDASLYDRLRFAAVSDIGGVVNAFLSKDGVAQRSTLMLNYLLVESILTASRIIREHGGDPEKLLPHGMQDERGIALLTKPEDISKAAQGALTRALEFRDTQSLSRYSETIRQACSFIEDNYTDPNVSLSDAAASVHLSLNHFCTVFSQETGTTFIGYLTHLRLERAKQLLENTQMRSSEVALEVGYRDPHYFSYLFKKNSGLSPRDWRKERQVDGS